MFSGRHFEVDATDPNHGLPMPTLAESPVPLLQRTRTCLPLYLSRVECGFPSPADDFIETGIDLNEHLIERPAATFLVRVRGDSMIGAGIHDDDVLIVDRAVEPQSGQVVVAALDAQLTVKRLRKEGDRWVLAPENPDYDPIAVSGESDLVIWGVVQYVIHSLR